MHITTKGLVMSQEHIKETKKHLKLLIDELVRTLGVNSPSKLWELAGVERTRWGRILNPANSMQPIMEDIISLVSNLRERGYNIAPEFESRMYEALGITIRQRKSWQACPPPPAPPYFGGRDEELQELKNCLKTGQDTVLTTVRGLGGIGKTTVARQLAHDFFYKPDEKIFQAVLWKEIKRKPDPLRLLLEWAYMVEPAFLYKGQTPMQLALQVKAMLENLIAETCGNGSSKNNNILVVFDDVWDDGMDTVRLLRQACPYGSIVLITTRSGRIAPLISAQELFLDKLNPENSIKMLQVYIAEADTTALHELAIVLAGHPLAMTLAAKRLLLEEKHLQPELLLKHIEEYRKGLPEGTPFSTLELEQGDEKEENLTKALYYSYAELDTEEQGLFRALGILPYNAPFNDGMLLAIWNLGPDQIKKPCKRLRLLSLLDTDELLIKNQGKSWYRQHPLVQSYARALLKDE
jgi:hypothetical protein